MPELPDLLSIGKYLRAECVGRSIVACDVKQSVVVRNTFERPLQQMLPGDTVTAVALHGPFISITLAGSVQLVINLMLAGRLQHQRSGERAEGYLCLSLALDDGSRLNLCDEKKMAKVYVVRTGEYGTIPKYLEQGVDVLSPDFTARRLIELAAKHRRKQVRVFINDQTILSAIGNAYADEILFEARIHPKTFVARLTEEDLTNLHAAIRSVLAWGSEQVAQARQRIQTKVREHMRVRNRKNQPCPRCGSKIRREGVRGHDVFFCPRCQPPSRELFLDWRKTD